MTPYYQHDGITIYHGDALFVLPELEAGKIEAVITDPPYSSGGQFRSDRMRSTVDKYVQGGTLAARPEFSGDNRDQHSFLVWCALWTAAARAACKQGAFFCCFSDWRQIPTITDAMQCGGWIWRGLAVWWKPGIRMQRGSFSHSAEYLVHGTNGPAERDYDGAQQNVFKCAVVEDAVKEHIAEKPAPVLNWIMNVAPPSGLVLDPFMGTGATLRAAKDSRRPAVGIEIEERYCERAANNLRQEVLDFTAAKP